MAKNALLKHRRKDIREAFAQTVTGLFLGPAEADTSARTLTGIVDSVTADGAAVFIDEHRSCKPLAPLGYAHGALAHSACESVRGDVCEQGTEKHMDAVAADMVGKRLRCDDLIAA
ncbi:MAG: hypothetical protein OXH86_19840 [Acidimicrobiaceae bacterium]|nr:hypothetical protein [Acidimicrobiaceae bacterium]